MQGKTKAFAIAGRRASLSRPHFPRLPAEPTLTPNPDPNTSPRDLQGMPVAQYAAASLGLTANPGVYYDPGPKNTFQVRGKTYMTDAKKVRGRRLGEDHTGGGALVSPSDAALYVFPGQCR